MSRNSNQHASNGMDNAVAVVAVISGLGGFLSLMYFAGKTVQLRDQQELMRYHLDTGAPVSIPVDDHGRTAYLTKHPTPAPVASPTDPITLGLLAAATQRAAELFRPTAEGGHEQPAPAPAAPAAPVQS